MGNSSTRNTYGIENEALSEESGGNEGQQPFIAVPADHQNQGQRVQSSYTTPAHTDTKEHNYQPEKQTNRIVVNQEKGADLVAAANAPDPRSHHSKQLSNKPLSRSDSFKAEDPVTSNSEDTTVNYVYQHTTTHHISSQEQPSQLDGQQIQLERKNSIGEIHLTPESLYNDIALGKVNVDLFACAVILCGTENCTKTEMVHSLLSKVVEFLDKNQERCFFEKSLSLSLCKCIILGCHPFENLTWLTSNNSVDETALSLLSYLSRFCKTCNQEPCQPFHDLITFDEPNKAGTPSQELPQQFLEAYKRLTRFWQRLKEDKALQAVAPQRICLVNIFDIGHTQSAQDLLPFLSKYCKHALTVVCYDAEHEEVLLKEFELKNQGDRRTPKYALLKQLCGIHKENPMALVALNNALNGTNTRDESGLKRIADMLKDEINVSEITAVSATTQESEVPEMKSFVEEQVMIAPFNCNKPIDYFLLLQDIKRNAKSFWMKRTDIDTLYRQYRFNNDSLDDVLKFFTTYGSLFYMYDVPSLRQYVVVNLVKFEAKMEELYQSSEPTAKYGLLKYRDDEDSRVVFDFLTTIGIAAVVKSSQVVEERGVVDLDTATNYYYIPTIRKSLYTTLVSGDAKSASPGSPQAMAGNILGDYTCTPKILQVSMLKHLLMSTNCLLIPTEDINVTAIRFFLNGDQLHDIEFIDNGETFTMYLKTKEKRNPLGETDASSLIKNYTNCPFFKHNDAPMSLDKIPTDERNKKEGIHLETMMEIAKNIAKQSKIKQEEFSVKLHFKQNYIEKTMEDGEKTDREVILLMLNEFQNSKGTNELKKQLIECNIKLEQYGISQT